MINHQLSMKVPMWGVFGMLKERVRAPLANEVSADEWMLCGGPAAWTPVKLYRLSNRFFNSSDEGQNHFDQFILKTAPNLVSVICLSV